MSSQAQTVQLTAKQHFLASSEREHGTTLRVLRACPADQLDLSCMVVTRHDTAE